MIYLKVIGETSSFATHKQREKLTFNHIFRRFSPLILLSFVILEPQVSILQGNEMLIGVGSNLNLTCFIKQTQDPYQSVADDDDDDDGDGNEWGRRRSSLRWSHNGEVCR